MEIITPAMIICVKLKKGLLKPGRWKAALVTGIKPSFFVGSLVQGLVWFSFSNFSPDSNWSQLHRWTQVEADEAFTISCSMDIIRNQPHFRYCLEIHLSSRSGDIFVDHG